MTPTLDSLVSCFQGLIPAALHTCSSDGIPNVAYLSHVEYVDASHIALSFQFFNKSRRNVGENPHALVSVIDPDTFQGWQLTLRYTRSEQSGPLFERMALRIESIASYTGLKGIFKLLAADIYEVLAIDPCAIEAGVAEAAVPATPASADPLFTVNALRAFADRIHRAESLEGLLDSALEALEETFGFTHAMILLPGETEGTFVTIASRGYPESGAGAEVRYGEGIIGMVAEARKPIRISGLLREMLYAQAVHAGARDAGPCPDHRRIPLPGLPNPSSQLGIPLLVRGDLAGVLCIESEVPYQFHEHDRILIELLGDFLAIAVQNMQLLDRADAGAESGPADDGGGSRDVIDLAAARAEVAYYAADECILVNGDYLIRGLPARILWKLLSLSRHQQRVEFTNRELRLDKSLNLPEYKDNLESRLLLLRRRLEQKCPAIRLVPRARGRFALVLSGEIVLIEKT